MILPTLLATARATVTLPIFEVCRFVVAPSVKGLLVDRGKNARLSGAFSELRVGQVKLGILNVTANFEIRQRKKKTSREDGRKITVFRS